MLHYAFLSPYIMKGLSLALGNSADIADSILFDVDSPQDFNLQSLTQDPNVNTDPFTSFDVNERNTDLFAD